MPTDVEIDIWRIDQRVSPGRARVLSRAECERADRLVRPEHAEAFRNRHDALRSVLAGYLDCRPEDLEFSTAESGKPFVQRPAGRNGIHFSLSDSGDVALIAVASGTVIGVDVEVIRTMDDLDSIAGRYFAPAEAKALLALEPPSREAAFFRCWTRKEAIMKAHGSGLALGLARLETGFAPIGVRGLSVDVDGGRYAICDLEIGDDCCAAVAAQAPIRRIRYRSFSRMP